jgi:hypothetical protein
VKPRCICGCGRQRGVQLHHVVYRQKLREIARAEHRAANVAGPPDLVREMALTRDRRNLVPVGPKCHAAHHNGSKRLRLHMLPDSAFEFAAEVMGGGAAFVYLSRRYSGHDARLDALLEAA